VNYGPEHRNYSIFERPLHISCPYPSIVAILDMSFFKSK